MHPAILLLIVLLLIVLACLIAVKFFGVKFGGMFDPDSITQTYGILNPKFNMQNACAQALTIISLDPIIFPYSHNYQNHTRTNFNNVYSDNLDKIIADHTISITTPNLSGDIGFYLLCTINNRYDKLLFLNYCNAVKFIVDNALFKDISRVLSFKLTEKLIGLITLANGSTPSIEPTDNLFPTNLTVSMSITDCHENIDAIIDAVQQTTVINNSSSDIVENIPLTV